MATIITTPVGLQAIEGDLTADYELGGNIDMTGVSFTPIGQASPWFTGSFDGKGYTISNLTSALFADIEPGSVVTDIIMEDCSVSDGENIAIFCQGIWGGTVSSIRFTNCDITIGATTLTASLFGTIEDDSTISSVYSDTDCSITGHTDLGLTIGMVASYVDGTTTISQCEMHGTINVTSDGAVDGGGITGYILDATTISNSCSLVDITVNTTYPIIGGIVGYVPGGEATLTNCYHTGTLSISGLSIEAYGIAPLLAGTVTSCYWLSTCGGVGGMGTSTSDANMKIQGTYSGWDFTTIWGIDAAINNGYPYLAVVDVSSFAIVTLAATEVWSTGATIHGVMERVGDPAYAYMGFQYGTLSDVSGETIHWNYSGTYSEGLHPIMATISGLMPDRTYYFRACLHEGTPPMTPNSYGSTLSFGGPRSEFGEGWEYVTAKKAEDDVSKLAVGRYYMDKSGNFVYESAKHRIA